MADEKEESDKNYARNKTLHLMMQKNVELQTENQELKKNTRRLTVFVIIVLSISILTLVFLT